MKYAILILSLFSLASCFGGQIALTDQLSVPTVVTQEIRTVPVQYIDFNVTNNTATTVSIAGFHPLCDCTSLLSTGTNVPPNGVLKFRAYIKKTGPTIEGVIIEDNHKNFYKVNLKLVLKK